MSDYPESSNSRNGNSPYGLRGASKKTDRLRDYETIISKRTTPVKGERTAGIKRKVLTGEQGELTPIKNEKPSSSKSSISSRSTRAKDSPRRPSKRALRFDEDDSSEYSHSDIQCVTPSIPSDKAISRLYVRNINEQSLGNSTKTQLTAIKNLLRLPKARRWVFCEFFYSSIDELLYRRDEEFKQLVKDNFPNLKTRNLRRPEWRRIRAHLGKPRRCSQAFFDEERALFEQKRIKIKQLLDGTFSTDGSTDFSDLPTMLPKPLAVGQKIYARVRHPKDGIYCGTIDAIIPEGYRIIFDKDELLQPQVIPLGDILYEAVPDLLPLNYFLEQHKASLPNQGQAPSNAPLLTGGRVLQEKALANEEPTKPVSLLPGALNLSSTDVDRVGNFPIRLLVILVKLSKLIEKKKNLVMQINDMNDVATEICMKKDDYHYSFQEKYAECMIDLEYLNKQMNSYMQVVQEYHTAMLPSLSEVTITTRPEALRKVTASQAVQIVKFCRTQTHSTFSNRRGIELVTSLTSLLLQIRQLGQQKASPLDLEVINGSIAEMRDRILPKNRQFFEDYVETHILHVHRQMSKKPMY